MIVVLIPLLIAALVYGAYKFYLWEAALYGTIAASATITLVVLAIAALCLHAWRPHRALHGRKVGGRRILAVSGDWGRLALNAEEKRGQLTLNGKEVRFIFGDIAAVSRASQSAAPERCLRLSGHADNPWRIPMASKRQADDWQRILQLAAGKKL